MKKLSRPRPVRLRPPSGQKKGNDLEFNMWTAWTVRIPEKIIYRVLIIAAAGGVVGLGVQAGFHLDLHMWMSGHWSEHVGSPH